MPDDEPWSGYRMCQPCSEVRHDDCMGERQWCECYVELMWEAEEMTDEPS